MNKDDSFNVCCFCDLSDVTDEVLEIMSQIPRYLRVQTVRVISKDENIFLSCDCGF